MLKHSTYTDSYICIIIILDDSVVCSKTRTWYSAFVYSVASDITNCKCWDLRECVYYILYYLYIKYKIRYEPSYRYYILNTIFC